MNYIEMYGLTYKRIAVLFCLICMLIGLVMSIQGNQDIQKTNLAVFLNTKYQEPPSSLRSLFHWSLMTPTIITGHNLSCPQTFDAYYLSSLPVNARLREALDPIFCANRRIEYLTFDDRMRFNRNIKIRQNSKMGKLEPL